MTNTIKFFVSIVSTMFLLAGCGVQGDVEDTTAYVPECSSDANCGDGYSCDDGMCQQDEPTPPDDPGCRLNSDCSAGNVCVAGLCTASPPAPAPACRLPSDCPADKECVVGICTAKPVTTPDPECTCDEDCDADEVCSADGTCVDKPEPPVTPECDDNSDCGANQVCTDGSCCDAPEPPVTTTCPETWTCGEWSECSNGSTARECSRTCSDGSVQNMTNGEECTTPDAGPAPEYLPDPVRSPKACVLDFSSYYMSGATKGEVIGNLPGMNWENGLVITDPDTDDDYAYAGITLTEAPQPGIYDITYVGYQGSTAPTLDAPAHYGLAEHVAKMRPEAQEYLQCNWYVDGEIVNVAKEECHIRFSVDEDCVITGVGNMEGFAG